ncbi:histidine phosphatase family protein [Camelliibacillus cellulosilyticus]|uniref:Histidine phosphatase family protein n=1 Tax=Camelliibacillus cellulosilyticus TaxID=2174486 RepID=A0ABV9GNH7_9BACL
METEIWLVRHGETEWNRLGKIQGIEDIALNETGIEQAKKVADYLQDEYFSAIISSPLQRALKTAEMIQAFNASHPPLVTDHDVVERHYGRLSGIPYKELKRYKAMEDQGIETLEALKRRALNVLDRVVKRYNGEKLCIVSHGGFIKTMLASATDNNKPRSSIKLDNCGVSKMSFQDQRWRVLAYNINEHLNGS